MRLLITPGEPAGIGPDITLQIAAQSWPVELVVVADPHLLAERAAKLKQPLTLIECDLNATPTPHTPHTLRYVPVPLSAPVQPGVLNPANSPYVLETLKMAAILCLNKKAAALVTGPVHKSVINQAGLPFMGHTELFAEVAGVKRTVMLFVVQQLKIALLTTHVPLAQVSACITQDLLNDTLHILEHDLQTRFHIATPRILVCGLNPHAGEEGYLGREEIDVITPVLNQWRARGKSVQGPLAADTIFTPDKLSQADAVLAMYHDQALPLVKYIGFGDAVNVTLGLPFIRTSVDHGTALDVAGTLQAKADSLRAAIKLAMEMVLR